MYTGKYAIPIKKIFKLEKIQKFKNHIAYMHHVCLSDLICHPL